MLRFNPRARFATMALTHMFQSTRLAPGATVWQGQAGSIRQFQSTRPARGATAQQRKLPAIRIVSIHAPRAGRDRTPCAN